jgi:hypothetical protein
MTPLPRRRLETPRQRSPRNLMKNLAVVPVASHQEHELVNVVHAADGVGAAEDENALNQRMKSQQRP